MAAQGWFVGIRAIEKQVNCRVGFQHSELICAWQRVKTCVSTSSAYRFRKIKQWASKSIVMKICQNHSFCQLSFSSLKEFIYDKTNPKARRPFNRWTLVDIHCCCT
jgi:hypothetical protein